MRTILSTGFTKQITGVCQALLFTPVFAIGSLVAAEEQVLSGLQGSYYSDREATSLITQRMDQQLMYLWRAEPVNGLPGNNFSVHWQGQLTAPNSGDYELVMRHDDNFLVRINGEEKLRVDGWDQRKAAVLPLSLIANKPVDINQLNHEIAKVLGLEVNKVTSNKMRDERKHINYDKGVLMWGSKEKLNMEIGLFLSNHQQSILRLKDQKLSENEQKLILHTLKGVAGSLALAKLLYLLSNAEKEREKESFPSLIAECEQEWQTLIALLADQQQPSSQQQRIHEVSLDAFISQIDTLQEQAEHAEIDDDLLSLVQSQAPTTYKEQVVEICAHFENFDFDAASTALLTLKHTVQAAKEHL